MDSSSNNFIQVGEPQMMDVVVTTASSGSSTLFIDGTQLGNQSITTTGTIGNNTSTTIGWTGYPYWNDTPWYVNQWPYPFPYRRSTDYPNFPFIITAGADEKIKISLREANDLKRAAKKDPKLAKILKKFQGMIEIEAGDLF